MVELLISSSVLIILILLLRFILKGKIPFGLQYALWLLVVIRLVVPGAELMGIKLFNSPVSIMNTVDKMSQSIQKVIHKDNELNPNEGAKAIGDSDFDTGSDIRMNTSDNTGLTEHENEQVQGETKTGILKDLVNSNTSNLMNEEAQSINWGHILTFIWLVGCIVVAAWIICVNLLFGLHLLRSRKKYEVANYKLPVYTVSHISSPCIYGVFGQQAVYITMEITEDEARLKHVLMHELCHYKHLDYLWSFVRCVLITIYWFHPLVWVASIISKRDCELACDEAAIKRLGEEERLSYGRTLISLISTKATPTGLLCTATTMTDSKKGIKERIKMITKKPKMLFITAVIVLTAIIGIVVLTFTGAEKPKNPNDVVVNGNGSENVKNDSTVNDNTAKENTEDNNIEGNDAKMNAQGNDAVQNTESNTSGEDTTNGGNVRWLYYRYPNYNNELLEDIESGNVTSYYDKFNVMKEFLDLYEEGSTDNLPSFTRDIIEVNNDTIGTFYLVESNDKKEVLLMQLTTVMYQDNEELWQVTKYYQMSKTDYENAKFEAVSSTNPPAIKYNGQFYSFMTDSINDENIPEQIENNEYLGSITSLVNISYLPEADFGSNFAPIDSKLYKEEDGHLLLMVSESGEKKVYRGKLEKTWNYGGDATSIEEVILSGKVVELNLEDSIDMDQDGKLDEISLKEEYSNPDLNDVEYRYTITINGQSLEGSGLDLTGELYAVSIDAETIQLLIPETGASDDYRMYVIGYKNGNIYDAGSLPGSPRAIYVDNGFITAHREIVHLQCYNVEYDYQLVDGKVVEKPREFYEQGNTVTVLRDVTLYKDKNTTEEGITLQAGNEVVVLGSDLKDWVRIEDKETGEKGWLQVSGTLCTLIDGTTVDSTELFEGLLFYD